jgi:hypothetical protein
MSIAALIAAGPLALSLIEPSRVSQEDILAAQDTLMAGPHGTSETEHYFADGVYCRVMKVPAGSIVIGKAHRTTHISILLKGKASITADDGSISYIEAPGVFVTPAGKKKMALVVEEMWFANIHPTDTEDLEVIEQRVIIPEHEFKDMLEAKRTELLAQGA